MVPTTIKSALVIPVPFEVRLAQSSSGERADTGSWKTAENRRNKGMDEVRKV